jgi:hypothetical protein
LSNILERGVGRAVGQIIFDLFGDASNQQSNRQQGRVFMGHSTKEYCGLLRVFISPILTLAAYDRNHAKEGKLMNLRTKGQKPIGPDELQMLHEMLRAWCEERNCELKSPEALEAARELVTWFDYAIAGRRQLRQSLRSL